MIFLKIVIVFVSFLLVASCNKNLTEEERKELWSKAQTTGEIINRSGTHFNSGKDKNTALRDAENRLQTGGGLLGKKGISVDGILGNDSGGTSSAVSTIGMPTNVFLWRGALETVSFMPINSADPIGGTILTDWYSVDGSEDERCKLNIFISGSELKTQNLKVTSFCQEYRNQKWVSKSVKKENNTKIENAILNKAKKLKLQSS